MTAQNDAATALYRFFDLDGVLLYVGISNDPTRRFTQHAHDKDWFVLVEHIDIEWFDARGLAEEAENESIWQERPRFNIVHRWPFRPRAGRRARRVMDTRNAIHAFAAQARNPWDEMMTDHQPEGERC